MLKEGKNIVVTALVITFLFFCIPYFLRGEANVKGNIIGFVYERDGTTPLKGAVVKIKNVSTGSIYDSSKSDHNGIFVIREVESGVYTYSVLNAQGKFVSENYFSVSVDQGETAKLSISLNPYEQEVAQAVQEVHEGQSISGETLVGKVIDYHPGTRSAEVYILNGLLQLRDRIHAKGKNTDFYQNVKELKVRYFPVKRVLPGQTAALKLRIAVKNGDLIYVVKKRSILPALIAIGSASIIAGSSGVIIGIEKEDERPVEPISPFKK